MLEKFSWKIILALLIMLLPLIGGFIADGWDVLLWILWVPVIYAVVSVVFIGIPAARRYYVKNGPKGILFGIIIILILIPLAFFGTCGLAVGGSYLKKLF